MKGDDQNPGHSCNCFVDNFHSICACVDGHENSYHGGTLTTPHRSSLRHSRTLLPHAPQVGSSWVTQSLGAETIELEVPAVVVPAVVVPAVVVQ